MNDSQLWTQGFRGYEQLNVVDDMELLWVMSLGL